MNAEGPANALANIAAAVLANVVTAIGAMAEAVATTALAAVQPRVRELEARVSALEAELTEERSARAAERERERERWGVGTCSCCQDRGAETRFLDCGHSCACEQCAARIRAQGSPCPLCRAEIRDVVVLRAEIRDVEVEGPSEPPRRRQRRR